MEMDRRDSSVDGWRLEARRALELIVRAIDDVENTSDERQDLLLADLLCAAWPTATAQDQ